jgi:hypothetical protein
LAKKIRQQDKEKNPSTAARYENIYEHKEYFAPPTHPQMTKLR